MGAARTARYRTPDVDRRHAQECVLLRLRKRHAESVPLFAPARRNIIANFTCFVAYGTAVVRVKPNIDVNMRKAEARIAEAAQMKCRIRVPLHSAARRYGVAAFSRAATWKAAYAEQRQAPVVPPGMRDGPCHRSDSTPGQRVISGRGDAAVKRRMTQAQL